jgi:hypothetical protein
MWYGFAAISTDTGHESGGATRAYRNSEDLPNWATAQCTTQFSKDSLSRKAITAKRFHTATTKAILPEASKVSKQKCFQMTSMVS